MALFLRLLVIKAARVPLSPKFTEQREKLSLEKPHLLFIILP
jgi:hypothetical protein